jgi:hypothetical protein
MKKLFILMAIAALAAPGVAAQETTAFSISLEELSIPGMPGVQSYAWAKTTDGKWVIFCGRTDGLHDHRPPFSFPANQANNAIWVVDPIQKQVWSSPISTLSTGLRNALSATNAQFQQVGDDLFIIGGYGVDLNTNQHKTYHYITSIDVTPLANAIISNQPITSYFTQITDTRFAITGGYMVHFGNRFHLVCGQDFQGRYNPHNGPSFTQTYSESIKRFDIVKSNGNLQIQNYTETVDANNLHRRDYNLVPQIFPNGDTGATVFSGVFQELIDIPHFNTIDVTATGYAVRQGFNQLLNQYHTAYMPLYDGQNNRMHTVFFGGIGMYFHDPLGGLVVDSLVPFVKTVSMVTRFANDSMVEYDLPIAMPAFLGASAEFIPSDSVVLLAEGIIDLHSLTGKVLAGYVVGGIESTDPNIFMFASSGSSVATNRIFKVYLEPGSFDVAERNMAPGFTYRVYPNPSGEFINVVVKGEVLSIELVNLAGEVLQKKRVPDARHTEKTIRFSLADYAAGGYYLVFRSAGASRVEQIVKQ